MKNNPSKTNKGFTLIEIMVATTIFMIVMLIGMGALVTSSNTANKAKALRTAMDNVSFAMESMTRTLRMGRDYGTSGGSITFMTGGDTPVSTTFGLNGTSLARCSNSVCINMTSPEVLVESLEFYVSGSDLLDNIQPSVYITMKGIVNAREEQTSFAIQTMVSQRSGE